MHPLVMSRMEILGHEDAADASNRASVEIPLLPIQRVDDPREAAALVIVNRRRVVAWLGRGPPNVLDFGVVGGRVVRPNLDSVIAALRIEEALPLRAYVHGARAIAATLWGWDLADGVRAQLMRCESEVQGPRADQCDT